MYLVLLLDTLDSCIFLGLFKTRYGKENILGYGPVTLQTLHYFDTIITTICNSVLTYPAGMSETCTM